MRRRTHCRKTLPTQRSDRGMYYGHGSPMNESEFEKFIAECTEALRAKNAALEHLYGLGSFARWDHDGDRALLTFSNPGIDAVLEAQTTDIGTYSLKTETWLWAWAN